MKKSLVSLSIATALFAASTAAEPVEYVRVCSLFGASFNYVPGTDTCTNALTGDTRVVTEGGVWRSLLPYPEGKWTTLPTLECGIGRYVSLGSFAAGDFTSNVWNRKQTRGVNVPTRAGEFVSKVIMSGGFYDPKLTSRGGVTGANGLCVRSVDPNVYEFQGGELVNPPFGNGMLPIGCVANSRILNMPASYVVAATAAYPSIDSYYKDADGTTAGPYTYGSQLVVTTDFGSTLFTQLQYTDLATQVAKPLAGRVNVAVCIDQGIITTPGGIGR